MTDLSTATVDQIKAELARRERVAKLPDPVPLPEPNFDRVTTLVHDYIKATRNGEDVSGFKIYVLEEAITAVYGLSVWRWINAKQQ